MKDIEVEESSFFLVCDDDGAGEGDVLRLFTVAWLYGGICLDDVEVFVANEENALGLLAVGVVECRPSALCHLRNRLKVWIQYTINMYANYSFDK